MNLFRKIKKISYIALLAHVLSFLVYLLSYNSFDFNNDLNLVIGFPFPVYSYMRNYYLIDGPMYETSSEVYILPFFLNFFIYLLLGLILKANKKWPKIALTFLISLISLIIFAYSWFLFAIAISNF